MDVSEPDFESHRPMKRERSIIDFVSGVVSSINDFGKLAFFDPRRRFASFPVCRVWVANPNMVASFIKGPMLFARDEKPIKRSSLS
jgi:hypothetical protein